MNYMPFYPVKPTNEGSILPQSTGRRSYSSVIAGDTSTGDMILGKIMNVDNNSQDIGGSTSYKDNAFQQNMFRQTVNDAQESTVGEEGENTPTRFARRLDLASFIVENTLIHECIHNSANLSTKNNEISKLSKKIDYFLNREQYAEVESLLKGHEKNSEFAWAYARLLKGYAYEGNVKHAERTFEKLIQITNVTTLNCKFMMRGYSNAGCHKKAEEFLGRMESGDLKKYRIKPDKETYTCLIYAYLNEDLWKPEDLLAKLEGAEYAMSRAYSEKLYPDNPVLISLLSNCKKNNNGEVVKKMLRYIPEEVYNSLLIKITNQQLKNFIIQAKIASQIISSESPILRAIPVSLSFDELADVKVDSHCLYL